MYKIVAMERMGDSVFRNEYNFKELKYAKEKYEKEKSNSNIEDVRLWYCVELERFVRNK